MVVFVAGATGATGQVLVPLAAEAGMDLRLHVRPATAPRTPLGADPRARIFDLADADALAAALEGCDAVVSLVGTTRARFATGDTYATADVGSTVSLVNGARAAGVPRMLLLSSVGAGGAGPYLQMKGECERIVTSAGSEGGLAWTIFRPAALASPSTGAEGTHGKRWAPGTSLTAALRGVPGVGGLVARYGPIPISVLARAMVRTLQAPRDGEIIEGAALWELGS